MPPFLNKTASPIRATCGTSRPAYVQSKIENRKSKIQNFRPGFTLIELLVVLVIVVTLVALAVAGLQRSPADRINASARQLQSQILLARSIAARDQRVSGVRLVPSASDPWVVDTVELISSPGFDTGTATVNVDGTGAWRITNESPGEWQRLFQRRLIRNGSRIEIPSGTGRWYQLQGVDAANTSANFVRLVGQFTPSVFNSTLGTYQPQPDPDNNGTAEGIPYRLELAATVTAGEEPLKLQPGTAIDLAGCVNVPLSREILFSPGQGLTGDNAAGGNIFLYLTTLEDVELTRNLIAGHPADSGPFDPSAPGLPIVPANPPSVPKTEPLGLAIFAQTGNVLSFSVDLTDTSPSDLKADEWFSYGRSGKEVGR